MNGLPTMPLPPLMSSYGTAFSIIDFKIYVDKHLKDLDSGINTGWYRHSSNYTIIMYYYCYKY